ncbi:MAG: hypothetical protein A2X35_02065 [Elusimicrobia bacterium GWA2_61_42]|nr:MAG: hypothetical protein A2X35_02065 [Elusimicrobia bacterium GWA2_61_42]OGR79840.1 MAG: hypothetical protein A2X38_12080 [Elusimicrobia bacterium GWC2_61_25]
MKKLLFLLLLSTPLAAYAQETSSAPWRASGRRDRSNISVGAGYSDAEGLRHRSVGLSGRTSLGRLAGKMVTLETSFGHHALGRDGWLPPELYNGGLRFNADDKKGGFSAGVRSNSDRLFNSMAETDVTLGASRVISRDGPHQFSFGLMYSSRRSFARGIPFPYLTYRYTSDRLSFTFPFAATWKATDTTELSASYSPPKSFQAGITKTLSSVVRLKAEYALGTLQYELAGRADKAYSVFIEQSNAGVWTYIKTSENCTLSFWTGYALSGKYYTGKTYDDHHDKRRIGTAPSASVKIERFF